MRSHNGSVVHLSKLCEFEKNVFFAKEAKEQFHTHFRAQIVNVWF